MAKIQFILILFILIFIAAGCHGCSFIKEKFGMAQKDNSNQQSEQQPQEQQERKVEPIPINPQHS